MSYRRFAPYYDALYRAIGKDYAAEAARLEGLIEEHGRSHGRRILDVACGTGEHLRHLRERWQVEGIDLDEDMLAVAREKLSGVPLHRGDMRDFRLGRRYDAVLCLFSAIGHARDLDELRRTAGCLAAHAEPGGVVVVEPWLTPETYLGDGIPFASFVDEPELKLARMNVSRRDDRITVLDFHYLVATPRGVERFTDRHELTLFTDEEYREALGAAGLETWLDLEGLTGRGLYLGRVRPEGRAP